jgi:transcription elongation GreA/GreB family factor
MSVAFTREEDHETRAADLPDRPVSPHPNLVTASGLALIEAELVVARTAYAAAQTGGEISADRTAMARATRELRYWSARRATAQLTEPEPPITAASPTSHRWRAACSARASATPP